MRINKKRYIKRHRRLWAIISEILIDMSKKDDEYFLKNGTELSIKFDICNLKTIALSILEKELGFDDGFFKKNVVNECFLCDYVVKLQLYDLKKRNKNCRELCPLCKFKSYEGKGCLDGLYSDFSKSLIIIIDNIYYHVINHNSDFKDTKEYILKAADISKHISELPDKFNKKENYNVSTL